MKIALPLFVCIIISLQLPAQDFRGQWKGQFTDKSTSFVGWGGDMCDYVLELECNGKNVTGYSYTYFNEGGKRFYTICKLTGTINKAAKYIEIKEIERTKTNVPNNIRNCFQVHRLAYSMQGEEQNLEGTWVPAPNQEGDCGYGTTLLSRRKLQKNPLLSNTPLTKLSKPVNKETVKTPAIINKKKTTVKSRETVKKKTIIPGTENAITKTFVPNQPIIKEDTLNKDELVKQNNADNKKNNIHPIRNQEFEKRNNTLLKTIEIENETFRVDLYDNGEIDGDSISLIFNGRLLLQHKRLSDKPISLTLKANEQKDINELVMYAENLGEIPPNTALMVVTDGENRYEVRISSDLEKSGVIRFVYKPKTGQ